MINGIAAAPKLGVGLLFNPVLPAFLEAAPDSFDYLEIIPDREWVDRGVKSTPRYSVLDKSLKFLRHIREQKPLVCHSVGLSIGSAALFDIGHIEQIHCMHEDFAFAWTSDHLAFARIPLKDHEMHTAISLPVPYDKDVLDLVIERVNPNPTINFGLR